MAQLQQQQQQQNQQEQNPETYDIVVHYTNQRLQREGFEWVDRPAGQRRLENGQFRPYSAASEEVHSTMRRVTDEFEQRFAEAFEELSGQLEVEARDSAYQTFQGILGATFQEGVSWSRIVALMCLNGALASKCVALHMPELVNEVVEWTVSYVENHLNDWIADHGGWQGFLDFYQNQDEVDGGWLNPRRVLGYAAGLVGVLTIGAFLGQRA